MTTERITLANLEQRCENVNRRLEGTGRTVQVQGRNGGVGLDEYQAGLVTAHRVYAPQCVRTLTFGTKREVGEFLHAMMVGIDLSRSHR